MSIIKGLGNNLNQFPGPAQRASRADAARSQGATDSDRARESGEIVETDGDKLSLTAAASKLRDLTNGLEQLPAVDRKRVEAVRNSLADGSFRINPERIADKLMQVEQLLGKSAPRLSRQ